jgi:hypothetical protein
VYFFFFVPFYLLRLQNFNPLYLLDCNTSTLPPPPKHSGEGKIKLIKHNNFLKHRFFICDDDDDDDDQLGALRG